MTSWHCRGNGVTRRAGRGCLNLFEPVLTLTHCGLRPVDNLGAPLGRVPFMWETTPDQHDGGTLLLSKKSIVVTEPS